jgi:hypothetical protein
MPRWIKSECAMIVATFAVVVRDDFRAARQGARAPIEFWTQTSGSSTVTTSAAS